MNRRGFFASLAGSAIVLLEPRRAYSFLWAPPPPRLTIFDDAGVLLCEGPLEEDGSFRSVADGTGIASRFVVTDPRGRKLEGHIGPLGLFLTNSNHLIADHSELIIAQPIRVVTCGDVSWVPDGVRVSESWDKIPPEVLERFGR